MIHHLHAINSVVIGRTISIFKSSTYRLTITCVFDVPWAVLSHVELHLDKHIVYAISFIAHYI